jgi:DNA-binding CsgD family transcriptional regulator
MKNIIEILNKRSTPGVLIIDAQNEVLHSNREAIEMIPVIKRFATGKAEKDYSIPEEILHLCEQLKRSTPPVKTVLGCIPAPEVHNRTDTSPYALRAFYIDTPLEQAGSKSIMVLMEKVAKKHQVDFEKAGKQYGLSKREMEVVRFVCQGLTNKEIGKALFISEWTVKDHMKNIMKRMNTKSRSEIIALIK